MGGLARRVSYAKLFQQKAGGIPVLVVDSGNSLASDTNAHGLVRPDVRVKDDWILKSFDQFKVDVINVAAQGRTQAAAHRLRRLDRKGQRATDRLQNH